MNVPLGELVQLRAGYPFRAGLQADPDGTVAVIQGRDVDPERLRIAPAAGKFTHIDSSSMRSLHEHLLKPTDVILMARGTKNYVVPVGTQLDEQAIVTGSFHVLRPKDNRVVPAYLAWLLNQEVAQTYMRANNTGTTIPMITLDALRMLHVILPPLDVQNRVADLNSLIENEHRLMTQLTTARRQLLRTWANTSS